MTAGFPPLPAVIFFNARADCGLILVIARIKKRGQVKDIYRS